MGTGDTYYNAFGEPSGSSQNKQETVELFEMCDICSHTFPIKSIYRTRLYGQHTKTWYTLRCCPTCNPLDYIEKL